MKYNVLCMGYENPNPDKIKKLLKFEESYLKKEYPNEKQRKNILIFSYVIMCESEKINKQTIAAARKNRIEYNLSFSDLETKPDNNGIQKFTIEV